MHGLFFFPTNHRVNAVKRKILSKIFTRCPKKSVRYNKCPLYRSFSIRVLPWFGRFFRKVFAITSCPLYVMSAIDRFDCIPLLIFECLNSNPATCTILRRNIGKVTIIHCWWSDGCASQFCSRFVFALMTHFTITSVTMGSALWSV